jgi:hypothetical protein
MCELCDKETGEEQSCQDCGRLICFDTEDADDVCAPARVTMSGDLFCCFCARGHDEAEEADEEEREYWDQDEYGDSYDANNYDA